MIALPTGERSDGRRVFGGRWGDSKRSRGPTKVRERCFACWTVANDQARAALFELSTERGKRAVKPPLRGSNWPPGTFLLCRPDKHRNHWTAPLDCGCATCR